MDYFIIYIALSLIWRYFPLATNRLSYDSMTWAAIFNVYGFYLPILMQSLKLSKILSKNLV